MTLQKMIFLGTVALIALMSVITFAVFCKDKKLAKSGKPRIMEKTLLALSACFGSVGALIGRIVAHHKTEKVYFSIVIFFSLVLHALLVCYLGYLAFLM